MGIDVGAERAERRRNKSNAEQKKVALEQQRRNTEHMAALREADTKARQVVCQQCGTAMEKGKKVTSSTSGQLMGCGVFLVGLVLLFFFPIGTVIGVFIMLGAAGMGVSRKRGMTCPNCKYFFETR